jgi:hypothetical protein
MIKLLAAGAIALAMTTGIALAQTTTSQVTTTVTPVIVAPPPGTLSVTRTEKSTDLNGTQTNTNETTYHNSNGVADDTVTKTTTYPLPVATTITKSSTSVTQ